ncbi:MAG: hypothetical protein BalsKO_14090 [Balneolaceae bacterium]
MNFNKIISKTFTAAIDMFGEEQKKDLNELFTETGPAHHKAFIEMDGFDPEWPIWYAEFLHKKVMDILDIEFTKSELIYLLVAADLDHQDEAPDSNWPVYYTEFFAESLS